MEYQGNSGGGPPSTGSGSNSGFLPWNSPFGDTTYTKIFVGGLAWETQNDALRSYFEQFGDILEAVVIYDKNTARSKGYGFVTFGDPESARRACIDPNPVINGRRANCNLASLGRPQPIVTYTNWGPNTPIIGGVAATPSRGAFFGRAGYQQPFPHGYPQAYLCPSYGYTPYGPEHVYQHGFYNPYAGQQYFQYQELPGTPNLAAYPYGSVGQSVLGNQPIHDYMTGHQVMHYGGSNANFNANSSFPSVHVAYHTGMLPTTSQGHPQYVIPVHPEVLKISDAGRIA